MLRKKIFLSFYDILSVQPKAAGENFQKGKKKKTHENENKISNLKMFLFLSPPGDLLFLTFTPSIN